MLPSRRSLPSLAAAAVLAVLVGLELIAGALAHDPVAHEDHADEGCIVCTFHQAHEARTGVVERREPCGVRRLPVAPAAPAPATNKPPRAHRPRGPPLARV